MSVSEKIVHRKKRVGLVTSTKACKTLIVSIERQISHPLYKKIVKKTTKIAVHDEKEIAQLGDKVQIEETRPLSKTKKWRLIHVFNQKK